MVLNPSGQRRNRCQLEITWCLLPALFTLPARQRSNPSERNRYNNNCSLLSVDADIGLVRQSTADICILTASANITRDVYQRYLNPQVSPERLLRMSVLTSLAVGALAALMAWQLQDVIGILLLGFTVNSAALFIPSLAMVYFSRWNADAAFWSISCSLLTVIAWTIAARLDGFPFAQLDALWPGLLVSMLVFVSLSRLKAP